MEQITDEWLKQVALAAYDSSRCESISDDTKAMIALHRAVSQAVARECERLMDDEIQRLDVAIVATATTDTAQASNNRGHILTRRDALRWAVSQINARFGLED